MKIEQKPKFSKTYTIVFYTIFAVFILVGLIIPAIKEDVVKTVYSEDFNGLSVKVMEPYITADEDTGKAIANIPVELTNISDHAFTFRVPHFSYNDTEYVSTIFNIDYNDVEGKITRETSKEGTVTITIDTRDLDSIKTLNPTIKVYDMKSEQEKEYKPIISVE